LKARENRAATILLKFFGVSNQAAINVKRANKKIGMNWHRKKFDLEIETAAILRLSNLTAVWGRNRLRGNYRNSPSNYFEFWLETNHERRGKGS
jgi:hypothetical protein